MMLINDICKEFHDQMRRMMDNAGIPIGYRAMLFHLAHDDACSQFELSQKSHLTPPTVSVTLQKMERDGYIERRTDEKDLRLTRVYLTERGAQIERENRVFADQISTTALSEFTSEEQQMLCALLARLSRNLSGTADGKPHKS